MGPCDKKETMLNLGSVGNLCGLGSMAGNGIKAGSCFSNRCSVTDCVWIHGRKAEGQGTKVGISGRAAV